MFEAYSGLFCWSDYQAATNLTMNDFAYQGFGDANVRSFVWQLNKNWNWVKQREILIGNDHFKTLLSIWSLMDKMHFLAIEKHHLVMHLSELKRCL